MPNFRKNIGNRRTASGGAGGSASATYTSNALNQYTAIATTATVNPVHDSDGNRISDGGDRSYGWNNENRLIQSSDGATTANYTYDYQGRLVKKDDGSSVEVYCYDDWNRIAKYVDSSLDQTYTWGLDLSGTLQGAGGVGGLLKEGEHYPCYDANGNIMQKLDEAGTMVMNVDYDPFGRNLGHSGPAADENDYGFSTKPYDDVSGTYYYGFRYYDPTMGRWLNRDPIGEDGGVNVYAFVGNDVIRLHDYLGLACTVRFSCDLISYDDDSESCEYLCDETSRVDSFGGSVLCADVPRNQQITTSVAGDECDDCNNSYNTTRIFMDDSLKKNCSRSKCRSTCDAAYIIGKKKCKGLTQIACNIAKGLCRDACNAICKNP